VSTAPLRVLVTAGAEKQSLAAVRSLGRAGAWVEVVDSKKDAPAFRSRYCRARWVSPSNRDRTAYLEFLLERARGGRYTTILACDDVSAECLSESRHEFAAWTTLLVPPVESFRIATDKAALVRFAATADIPVPRTLYPTSRDDARRAAAALGFPLIVKGAHGWGAQHVRLVLERAAFDALYDEVAALEAPQGGGLPMLQQYVVGVGCGVSVLFRHGEPRAAFVHQRAAEFDVASGGVPYSCPAAESVRDDALAALGVRLFTALDWHGLGMAEWRRETSTGRLYLMEINARLVGSADLAVQSGVDLPLLAAQLARDGDVPTQTDYTAGVRLHWLLPDGLLHLLARPARAFDARALRSASDWSWRDPLPHWVQLRRAAWALRHR
jgi:predicted ATP-grasp superfamily ATP-dependent carboligase